MTWDVVLLVLGGLLGSAAAVVKLSGTSFWVETMIELPCWMAVFSSFALAGLASTHRVSRSESMAMAFAAWSDSIAA